jgi:predicted nucleotidyltransferase component of viral defense system
MLHFETVESGTLSILRSLMNLPELKDFHLVGGTALSLMYGHRTSVDLDFFSVNKFDNELIINSLKKEYYGRIDIRTASHFGIFCFIDGVKVDIVRFPHPLIRPTIEEDGIRMYSAEEIIAMKVQAILGRGKKKDFWDIAELLQHFTVKEFIDLHKEKYSTQNLYITVPQAITYFDDAEESEDPVSLKGQTWKNVKKYIQKEVRKYLE